jgi:hypothetical protein
LKELSAKILVVTLIRSSSGCGGGGGSIRVVEVAAAAAAAAAAVGVVLVTQLVEVLRYKPAGCGFDPRWRHWNFLFT